jgi:glycosyltransferase involved in cell wall biosynthesis
MNASLALSSVTIIVVTYNSAHCLTALHPLLQQAPHVIVSDNASGDGTAVQAQALWTQATVLAHERNLPHHAATAAAFGLDREAALRAVTAEPCRIAGIDSKYGTIAPLKSATIILTRGHPLEITSDVAAAWIDGRSIDLTSHQSQMKAKYEQKPGQGGTAAPAAAPGKP